MATKRRFKFDSIVISRATVAGGKNLYPGTVLDIYGKEAEVTEEEVLVLISREAAMPGTKENIAKVRERVQSSEAVAAKAAEQKARSEQASHELATKAMERLDNLEEVVIAAQHKIVLLEELLTELRGQLTVLAERAVPVELSATVDESAAKEK